MKKLNLFKAVIFSGLIFMLVSCGDDESPEITDDEKPLVSITNLSDGEIVIGKVTLDINASDNESLDRVDVYIDDQVLAERLPHPYIFEWDTKNIEDGQYNIKVVATDKVGNQSIYTKRVVVRNILLTIEVPSNFVHGSEQRFIFVSDEVGKNLGYAKLENGASIEIGNTSFKGASFSLTEVYFYENNDKEINLRTYGDIKPGSWIIEERQEDGEFLPGDAIIKSKNADTDNYFYKFISNSGWTSLYTYNSEVPISTVNVELKNSPSHLLVAQHNLASGFPEKYKLYENISIGENDLLDLNELDEPYLSKEIQLPGYIPNVTSVRLFGILEKDYGYEKYRIGDLYVDHGQYKIFYPNNVFSQYLTSVWHYEEDKLMIEGLLHGIKDVAIPSHDVSAILDNNTLKYSAEGDFTFCYAAILPNKATFDGYGAWSFILPEGEDKSLALPELPDELKVLFGEEVEFNAYGSYGLYKIGTYEAYEDFLLDLSKGNTSIDNLYLKYDQEYLIVQYFEDKESSNSRISAHMPRNPLRLKRGF